MMAQILALIEKHRLDTCNCIRDGDYEYFMLEPDAAERFAIGSDVDGMPAKHGLILTRCKSGHLLVKCCSFNFVHVADVFVAELASVPGMQMWHEKLGRLICDVLL